MNDPSGAASRLGVVLKDCNLIDLGSGTGITGTLHSASLFLQVVGMPYMTYTLCMIGERERERETLQSHESRTGADTHSLLLFGGVCRHRCLQVLPLQRSELM